MSKGYFNLVLGLIFLVIYSIRPTGLNWIVALVGIISGIIMILTDRRDAGRPGRVYIITQEVD